MQLFTDQQEVAIVQMVVENNAIRLREIQQQMIEYPAIFHNIRVSLSQPTCLRNTTFGWSKSMEFYFFFYPKSEGYKRSEYV
jgi:hypothetical protein